MRTEHTVRVDAPRERVWALLMDIPQAALLVPGVGNVAPAGTDPETYRGSIRVQVGPVRLALDGEVRVIARDDAAGTAAVRLDGADSRLGGGVRADVRLEMSGSLPTEVRIATDITVLGRIGELGQPLMKRKADQVMAEFGRNLQRALGEP